jgi:hypothetical protein
MHQSLVEIIIDMAPMLLLVGVWIFFIFRIRRGGFVSQHQKDCLELTRRQTEALERIAKLLEAKAPHE